MPAVGGKDAADAGTQQRRLWEVRGAYLQAACVAAVEKERFEERRADERQEIHELRQQQSPPTRQFKRASTPGAGGHDNRARQAEQIELDASQSQLADKDGCLVAPLPQLRRRVVAVDDRSSSIAAAPASRERSPVAGLGAYGSDEGGGGVAALGFAGGAPGHMLAGAGEAPPPSLQAAPACAGADQGGADRPTPAKTFIEFLQDLVRIYQVKDFFFPGKQDKIDEAVLGMRQSPVPVRVPMQDYVGILDKTAQRLLYKSLGVAWTDEGGGTMTEMVCEADPPTWAVLTSTRARGQGVCRVWSALIEMVGQDAVECRCTRMECDVAGEMHRIWVCVSDDRPAMVVLSWDMISAFSYHPISVL